MVINAARGVGFTGKTVGKGSVASASSSHAQTSPWQLGHKRRDPVIQDTNCSGTQQCMVLASHEVSGFPQICFNLLLTKQQMSALIIL